jgi:putative transposase
VRTHTRMTVRAMCTSCQVSRAGLYRQRKSRKMHGEDMDARHEIQQIALQWPCYGSRRIAAELRARGQVVNRKKVQSIMRDDNLLCAVKRKFIATTDSGHRFRCIPTGSRR